MTGIHEQGFTSEFLLIDKIRRFREKRLHSDAEVVIHILKLVFVRPLVAFEVAIRLLCFVFVSR